MSQKAIIHTATRVIKRVTTDTNPFVVSDESIIDLAQPIDLSGGFWKLDNNNLKVVATQQDIDDSGVDEDKKALDRKKAKDDMTTAIESILSDIVVPNSIKSYFQALKKLG